MKADSPADGPLPEQAARLFGRADDLARLRSLLQAGAGTSELVCVVGEGGIGKTRLLEALVAEAAGISCPSAPIVDFYHIDTFRSSALEEMIVDALEQATPELGAHFEGYRAARADLEQSRMSGAEFEHAQAASHQAFVACYNAAAAEVAKRGARILLPFDTVEQAVALSDGADRIFGVARTDASAGGEHWLRATLPQLQNTLIVLSGRAQTLYGEPVTLYDDLGARLTRHDLALAGLSYEATVELAQDMLARARSSPDEQTAGVAAAIDLDDPTKLRAWHQLSGGLPFWISILFTLEQIGNEPKGLLSALQQEVAALDADGTLTPQRREQLRGKLRDCFLGQITQAAPTPLVILQCMATIRKGLTPALLAELLALFGLPGDPEELFGRLQSLALVKTRRPHRYTSPGERPGDRNDREVMLFLHDELYAWLDTHPPVTDESRLPVRDMLLTWYRDASEQADAERLAAVETLRLLRAGDPQAAVWEAKQDDAQRRKRQLQRDLLGYAYEERQAAAAQFQIFAYEAIFNRDDGQETALRQEVLRNLYRPGRGLGPADELTFAALWLLRAAVQNEDSDGTHRLLSRLDRFEPQRRQAAGADLALFELATAVAALYIGRGTLPTERAQIEAALDRAEAAVVAAGGGPLTTVERQWLRLLRAQTLNFRGYLHRLNYELTAAIRAYRASERVAKGEPELLPQFRATTLNNLAYALSEQGDTEEARRVALIALNIRQRHGTRYNIGFSYNTLGRIAIREGNAEQALRYTLLATAIFRELESPRGLILGLPTLVEAYRKYGELLDDTPAEQDNQFQHALATLDEVEQILQRQRRPSAQARREILQNRGAVYRSWGLALMRRGVVHRELAKRNLSAAHTWLMKALQDAERSNQPPLIRLDILEDLAAVHVNEDEYDQRIDEYLDQAEALAPQEYKVQEGAGPQELDDATRGYWRELGQCRLQRMLAAFGKHDFGRYHFDPESGTRILAVPPGDEGYFDEAAEHLVVMMAYLVRYNRYSWMLGKARELALRELLERSPEQIDRIQLGAYHTAKLYNLLYDESFTIVEQVIRLARENLGLEG